MIQATRYIRPNGKQRPITLHLSPEESNYVNEEGIRVGVEMLPDGMEAVYLRHPTWEEEDELTAISSPENLLLKLSHLIKQCREKQDR